MATVRKSNGRLYFFIVGYTLCFALLASLGTIEVGNIQEAQWEKQQRELLNPNGKFLYALPRMELTLPSLQGNTHHARIGITLEIDEKNMQRFEDFQPRVSDRLIQFFHQQDIDELDKPSMMPKLRRNLLKEANSASPIKISDIIFREFLVR
jgi:flagellar basal body-associated protein FliL